MLEIFGLTDGDSRAKHFFMEALHVLSNVGEDVRPHVDAIISVAQEVGGLVVVCDSPFTVNHSRPGLFAHFEILEEIFGVLL